MVEKQFSFYSDKKRDPAPVGIDGLEEPARQFLTALFELTEGNTSRQASMYKVGEAMGMDRDEASRTAELLIGNGLAEIKTLSGGIGITEAAVTALKTGAEEGKNPADKISPLTQGPVVDAAGLQSIDMAVTTIKHHIHEMGLKFDAIAGVIADIKTIEAQLTSPAPKTAILRECFVSLKSWADKTNYTQIKNQIQSILGG